MRVHLVCWDADEGRARATAIAAAGYEPAFLPGVTGTPLMRALRASDAAAIVIDLERRPSHGREVAMALRSSKATRQRPILFVGGTPETTAKMRALLPDAVYTTWGRLKTALPRALKTAPAEPVVPGDTLYAGRTLAQKLGLAANDRIAVASAPPGLAAMLGPLPDGARLTGEMNAKATRVLWFVKTDRELAHALATLDRLITSQVAWLAWPKGSSGVATSLDGNVVREAGLAAGFVDFKVCSVDATWSALAFKRRRR